jgi:hypothetical protein
LVVAGAVGLVFVLTTVIAINAFRIARTGWAAFRRPQAPEQQQPQGSASECSCAGRVRMWKG